MPCPLVENRDYKCECKLNPLSQLFHGIQGLPLVNILSQLINKAIAEKRALTGEEISAFAAIGQGAVDKRLGQADFIQMVELYGNNPADCPNFDPDRHHGPRFG